MRATDKVGFREPESRRGVGEGVGTVEIYVFNILGARTTLRGQGRRGREEREGGEGGRRGREKREGGEGGRRGREEREGGEGGGTRGD